MVVAVGNHLIDALPLRERNAVQRVLEQKSFALGDVLLNAETRSQYAYFPIDSVVSLVRTMRNGTMVEVGLVGSEGVVGIDIFMEASSQPNEALVQGAGSFYRIEAEELLRQFKRPGELQRRLLRFTNVFITQISQTAACNRVHPVDQRLARWLLMMQDRLGGSSDILLTQSFLARMLGTRIAGVNEAVQRLESKELIRNRRQQITVTDREGLEIHACECYEFVRQEYIRDLES